MITTSYIYIKDNIQSSVEDLLTSSDAETFLKDILEILKCLLQNFKNMFSLYYMHSTCGRFKSSATKWKDNECFFKPHM